MKTINVTPNAKSNAVTFNKEENAFYGSERDIQFSTQYCIQNVSTGNSQVFDFKYSTGSEFDPNTKWVFESEKGVKLFICNDPEITKKHAEMYLAAKLRNS